MNRLAINNPLFETLATNPPAWWESLVRDTEISIQIRKDNYIDVYYNGGNIVGKLKFDGKLFHGEIHYKYIPLESECEYIPYIFETDSVRFYRDCDHVKVMELNCFDEKALREIKNNIRKFYPSESEKAIQYTFIKNDHCLIDSEFAYNNHNGETIRIDLVRMDTLAKKIVFVEVKTMGDRRLFNNEIIKQIEDYKDFITHFKPELLQYYKKILKIKRNIGILPDCIKKENIDDYEILEKPLLLFGDCEQSWIDRFSKELDEKIKAHAIGCYYFGKPNYSCEIINSSKQNRHIF